MERKWSQISYELARVLSALIFPAYAGSVGSQCVDRSMWLNDSMAKIRWMQSLPVIGSFCSDKVIET